MKKSQKPTQADSVIESIERAVLGCVVVSNELWAEASELNSEHFALDSHRLIFGSMRALADAGKPIARRRMQLR